VARTSKKKKKSRGVKYSGPWKKKEMFRPNTLVELCLNLPIRHKEKENRARKRGGKKKEGGRKENP